MKGRGLLAFLLGIASAVAPPPRHDVHYEEEPQLPEERREKLHAAIAKRERKLAQRASKSQ